MCLQGEERVNYTICEERVSMCLQGRKEIIGFAKIGLILSRTNCWQILNALYYKGGREGEEPGRCVFVALPGIIHYSSSQ